MDTLRKRVLAMLLVVSMVLSTASPAFAAELADASVPVAADTEAGEAGGELAEADAEASGGEDESMLPEDISDQAENGDETSAAEPDPEAGADLPDESLTDGSFADESLTDESTAEQAKPTIAEPTVTITPEEQNKKVLDAVMETYIREHADASKVGTGDLELANIMTVQQTLYASDILPGDATIDYLMTDGFEETSEGWMGAYHAVVPVYTSGDGAYYVAYANTMFDDGDASVQDVAFAHNNTSGEELHDCIYDGATGLAYIPKTAYLVEGSNDSYYNYIQVQFLQRMNGADDPDDVDSSVQVVTESKKEVDSNTQADDPALLNTTVQSGTGMKESKVTVSVNGIPLDEDGYLYDSETGEVIVGVPSAAIASITVTEEPTTAVDTIKTGLAALAGVQDAYAATLADMGISPVIGTIEIPSITDTGTVLSLDVGDHWKGTLMYEIAPEGTDLWNRQGIDNDIYLYKDPNHATIYNIDGNGTNDLQVLADAVSTGDTSRLGGNLVNMGRGYINAQALLTENGDVSGTPYGPQTFNLYYKDGKTKKSHNFPFTTFGKIGLACGHISSDIMGGVKSAGGTRVIRQTIVRVLAKGTNSGRTTLTIGLLSASTNGQITGQSGVALYRVYYKYEEAKQGYVKVVKKSTENISGNTNYSLKGTTFELTDGKKTYTITTDEKGNSKAIAVPVGTYTYKETKTGTGMNKDAKSGKVTVTKDHTSTVPLVIQASDSPQKGKAYVVKTSTDEQARKARSDVYELKGTTVKIYKSEKDRDAGQNAVATLECDADGNSKTVSLLYGKYYFKEVKQGRNIASSGKNTTGSFTLTKAYKDEPYKISIQNDLKYGYLKFVKVIDDKAVEGNPAYDVTGTEFTVYPSEQDMRDGKNAESVFRVGEDGTTEAVKLTLGTHWYKETKAGKNMASADITGSVEITAGNTAKAPFVLEVTNSPNYGSVRIRKKTPVMDASTDLTGAVYTLYEAGSDKKVGDMVVAETDDAGTPERDFYSNTLEHIPYGKYYYKETKAPANGFYQLDPEKHEVEIKASKVYTFDCVDIKNPGISIVKKSALPNITDRNSVYSIGGAQYGIYASETDAIAHRNPVLTFTLDANGKTEEQVLTGEVLDAYWYSEIMAGAGYSLDLTNKKPVKFYIKDKEKNPSNVTVTDSNCYVISVEDEPYDLEPQNGKLLMFVEKKNAETGSPESVGKASLKDAVFEVRYYDGYFDKGSLPDVPERKWRIKTVLYNDMYAAGLDIPDSLIQAESDPLYTRSGKCVIPCGTLAVSEVQAPKGYCMPEDSVVGVVQITPEKCQTPEILLTELSMTVEEQVVRGDLSLLKVSTRDGAPMANVPFAIISKTTGEQHIAVTGADGVINTASLRESGNAARVNGNDAAFATGRYNGGELDPSCPVWFSGIRRGENSTETTVDLGKGALPYDTYVIRELRSSANTAHELIDDVTVTVSKDGAVVACGRIDNEYIELRTEAAAIETKLHTASSLSEDASIGDRVYMEGLDPMTSYTVFGTLRYASDGSPVQDAEGRLVTSSKQFTPQTDTDVFTQTKSKTGKRDICGYVTLEFHVDPHVLDVEKGTRTVVFEQLFFTNDLDGNPVADHEDKDDEGQVVTFPMIRTNAVDIETGTHMGLVSKDAGIVDHVTYNGLYEGDTYIIRGVLVDKDVPNGEPLAVANTGEFTASATDGTKELTFSYDASGMAGKSVVVYEYLYVIGTDDSGNKEEILVAKHEDANDENQTVVYPSVNTEAKDGKTGTHTGSASGMSTIVDRVYMDNLLSGIEYTINGVLMDEESEKELLDADGNKITQTVRFSIEDAEHPAEPVVYDGGNKWHVDLVYEVDASLLAGKTAVVFEDLLVEEKVIAFHHDIHDESQSVHYPMLRTVAQGTKGNILKAGANVSVVDTAEYSNIAIGEDYVIRGYLVEKNEDNPENSKPLMINGRIVTAEAKINKADKADGKERLTFTFNATGHEGKTLVVYENLYQIIVNPETDAPEEVLRASHENPEDKAQTVYVPKIATTLVDGKTGNHIAPSVGKRVLVDTVTYENLVVGKKYSMSGTLQVIKRDKDGVMTSEPLLDADGNPVTKTEVFEADEANGAVEIRFEIDASLLAGETVVAFESLKCEEVEIAIHADITDENQTVYFPEVRTTLIDADTDGHITLAAEDRTVVDTVKCINIVPGMEYEIEGALYVKVVDKDGNVSGEALKGADGKEVTASEKFVAQDRNEVHRLTFDFDASLYEGKAIVCFETLKCGEEVLAEHNNIRDEDQTVYVPMIGTVLLDDAAGGHITKAVPDAHVTDSLAYKKLIPGLEYTVEGILVVKETKETVKENTVPDDESLADTKVSEEAEGKSALEDIAADYRQAASASVTFTPESESGIVEIPFTFDASEFGGETLVAFETVRYREKDIAIHANINDEEQSIHIPKIATTLTDHDTKSHISFARKECILVDNVKYTDLISGKEYTVTGTLMNKKSGKELLVDGKPITSTRTFTPQEPDGFIEVPFSFDSSLLAGTTVVAFESVSVDNVEIAVHAELSDEDQAVHIPEIRTFASVNGKKEVTAGEKVDLIDTVKYKNAVPGMKYYLTGTVMDKVTKKPFKVNDTILSKEISFVPEKAEGSVQIQFEIDTKGMKDCTLVVFEEMKAEIKDTESGEEKTILETVAVHQDLDDQDQTVSIKDVPPTPTPETSVTPSGKATTTPVQKPSTTPGGNRGTTPGQPTEKVKTGDTDLPVILAMLVFVSCAVIATSVYRKRKA